MKVPGDRRAWTATELAALRLPGLPATRQGMYDRARREGWPSVARRGRGGGRAYTLEALAEVLPRCALRQLRRIAEPPLSASSVAGVHQNRPAGGEHLERPAWFKALLTLYQRPGKPSISACYEALARERCDLPSLRTCQRAVR